MSVAIELRNPLTNELVAPTVTSSPVTIATTSATDAYVICPCSGVLDSVDFTSLAALAAHDTNFVTFSLTNLGQAGAGTTVLLAATAANTTKITGGAALVANARRQLTLSATLTDLRIALGDVLRVRFTAGGTLAGTVTNAQVQVRIDSGR